MFASHIAPFPACFVFHRTRWQFTHSRYASHTHADAHGALRVCASAPLSLLLFRLDCCCPTPLALFVRQKTACVSSPRADRYALPKAKLATTASSATSSASAANSSGRVVVRRARGQRVLCVFVFTRTFSTQPLHNDHHADRAKIPHQLVVARFPPFRETHTSCPLLADFHWHPNQRPAAATPSTRSPPLRSVAPRAQPPSGPLSRHNTLTRVKHLANACGRRSRWPVEQFTVVANRRGVVLAALGKGLPYYCAVTRDTTRISGEAANAPPHADTDSLHTLVSARLDRKMEFSLPRPIYAFPLHRNGSRGR